MDMKWELYARWFKHHVLVRTPLTETPIAIVSYPKSGRTWLRMMLGYILCETYKLDKSDMLNTALLAEKASLPYIGFNHAGSGLGEHTPPILAARLTEQLVIPFSRSRVILLIRDPRDVLVSAYFQATKRIHVYEGDLSSFIRTETFGIQKILQFYEIWHRYSWFPRQLIVVRYEDLHGDTRGTLEKVLQFINLHVDCSVVDKAIEYAHFDSMRSFEKQRLFDNRALIPGDINDSESYKVRKGMVKGYLEYLSNEDIQYLDDQISASPTAFAKCYT